MRLPPSGIFMSRHVPISLYIDTEVFCNQGFNFDTAVFRKLKTNFLAGHLRLLVPKITEREILRHFDKKADDTVRKLLAAHEDYYINRLALITLPKKEDLKNKYYDEMCQQWMSFKKFFTVENLPIVGKLEDVIDWYFDVKPPFATGKKDKEFPDALIISVLDEYHRKYHVNIAVVGQDNDFRNACATRSFFSHFNDLNTYIEAFQPELSGKSRESGDIDPTIAIATEDLTELKAALSQGEQVTPLEVGRVMSLLTSRGTNYDYFFQTASTNIWMSSLSEKGYFSNPPDAELTKEGYYIDPPWPPAGYLLRIFDASPKEVLDEIAKFPPTNNLRILECILKVVLRSNSADTVLKFSSFIFAFIKNCRWGHELIIELLKKPFILDQKLSGLTTEILLKTVEFHPDPNEEEKESRRNEGSETWGTSLEPTPSFKQWEYQQILEHAIRPLAEKSPYLVAHCLIDSVSSMLRMSIHREDVNKNYGEDYSEIWCGRLNIADRNYQDTRGLLIHILTYACEQVYEKVPESITAIDLPLRNQPWKVFKRLRQHLYGRYPTDKTLPWIREIILEYNDYSENEYRYEFQVMIRSACEYFGSHLLSETEKVKLFDAILSGPSKERYREWVENRYSEELFQKRQRWFHRMQLRPFVAILSGKYKLIFDDLQREESDQTLSDESYSPYVGSCSGVVSYKSPKTFEELEHLSDDDLLTYLNAWDEEHRDKDNWLVEVNISALADVFRTFFREKIVPQASRLCFWMDHVQKIERPVYITAITKAFQELVKSKDFTNLNEYFKLCMSILTRQNTDNVTYDPESAESLSEKYYSTWRGPRQAVIDFIDTCLSSDVNAPIAERKNFANLLKLACTQFDYQLDSAQSMLRSQSDQITVAINSTRGNALESLIRFGFWVRQNLPEDTFPEITDILSMRMGHTTERLLTTAEHSLLGMRFGDLCVLLPSWVMKHKDEVFPKNNELFWVNAFGSFIQFNRPTKLTFDILQDDFRFALSHLNILTTTNGSRKGLVDRLGQHIFAFYLWGVYPFVDNSDNMLSLFYKETEPDRNHWGKLLDYVGQSLKNSGKHLEKQLVDRAIAYFDWRFKKAEPLEFQHFTFWLGAECLPAEWRLCSYLKFLRLGTSVDNISFSQELCILNSMFPDHLSLVIDCLLEITNILISKSGPQYFSDAAAKNILRVAFASEDTTIRDKATRIRENLLKTGNFDFLEIE